MRVFFPLWNTLPFATLLSLLGPESVRSMAEVGGIFARILYGGKLYRQVASELRADEEELSMDDVLHNTTSVGLHTPANAYRKSIESRYQERKDLLTALHSSYVFGLTRQTFFASIRACPVQRYVFGVYTPITL